jgi:hypothetical protein
MEVYACFATHHGVQVTTTYMNMRAVRKALRVTAALKHKEHHSPGIGIGIDIGVGVVPSVLVQSCFVCSQLWLVLLPFRSAFKFVQFQIRI